MLAVNSWDEDVSTLRRFVHEYKLRHRILIDGGEVAERYGIGTSVPRAFWIDAAGVIVDADATFDGPSSLHRKADRLVQPRG